MFILINFYGTYLKVLTIDYLNPLKNLNLEILFLQNRKRNNFKFQRLFQRFRSHQDILINQLIIIISNYVKNSFLIEFYIITI